MPSDKRVRIAFIGCGNHSVHSLQPAICHVPEFEYIATCDIVAERAKEAARRFGAKAWYTDYMEMLEREALDAVVVVGHPNMHEEVSIECLKRGVHVLMEKPPALTVEGARRIVEVANESNRFCMVATHWRHMPTHQLLKRIASSDAFGSLTRIEVTYVAPDFGPAFGVEDYAWGFMLNQAIHPVDCMQFLGGKVQEISAHGSAIPNERLMFTAYLRFESGVEGSLTLAGCAALIYARVIVQGSGRGIAEVDNFTRLRYFAPTPWVEAGDTFRGAHAQTWEVGNWYHRTTCIGYIEELQHFARCIIDGKEPHANANDAYHAMRILDAIVKSAMEGKPMTL